MSTIISDNQWLEFNLKPETSPIRLPSLPPDAVQLRFTGRAGRQNLQQAFEFYRFIIERLPSKMEAKYNILDFGGGWGRILRFFLKDFPADKLLLADCLTDAIEHAKGLNPPFKIIQNDIKPPLPIDNDSVDVAYAFSVFSHLSEKAARNWITDIGLRLVSGGKLFITTRGKDHLAGVRHMKSQTPGTVEKLKSLARRALGKSDHVEAIRTRLPSAGTIEQLLNEGIFQFYPTGGGGELSDSFYGEAWMPERWVREKCKSLGFSSYEFQPESAGIDQCVIVLTK
jgi:hypothetical protein